MIQAKGRYSAKEFRDRYSNPVGARLLGHMMRQRMRDLGLTLRELAQRIRLADKGPISEQYVGHLLAGDRGVPPAYLLQQFCEVLQLPEAVVFYLAGHIPPQMQNRTDDAAAIIDAFDAFWAVIRRAPPPTRDKPPVVRPPAHWVIKVQAALARAAKVKSRKTIAREIGVGDTSIARWMTGERVPSGPSIDLLNRWMREGGDGDGRS